MNANDRYMQEMPHQELMLPWNTFETWDAANQAIHYLINRWKPQLQEVVDQARQLQTHLENVFPYLDHLCNHTCRFCPDPCCLKATVWFDFKDLLFLNIVGRTLPEGQPKTPSLLTCRYFSAHGCRLSRISRPWACTLFLCSPQLGVLRKMGSRQKERCEQLIAHIKTERHLLEAQFIHLTR